MLNEQRPFRRWGHPPIIRLVFLLAWATPVFAQVAQTSAANECRYTPYIPTTGNYAKIVSSSDPFLGAFDAPVTVIEFFDPNCSHCRDLHPVMQELVSKYEDRARFFMVPFVLWPYSLGQVEALYVAAAKGKYYEMLDVQFEAQKPGGLSIDDLRVLATGLGIDPDWLQERIEEGRHQKEIIDRRTQIHDLGVSGTPALMINGKYVLEPSTQSAECLGSLIEGAMAAAN